ncbi:MAG: hypothetical protein IPL78_18215 [Chloroflexi bacterium]|nr:hypothetical protein [Chloroflexota bacterium]
MPPIQAAVDVYDRQSEEVLLLADGIQVKEQAAKRQKRSERRAEEKLSFFCPNPPGDVGESNRWV